MNGFSRRVVANRVYPLFILVLIVNVVLNPSFVSELNLRGLLVQASTTMIVCAGLAVVLICGQIDLSVGSTLGLASMVAVGGQAVLGTVGAIIAALATGLIVGAVNGLLVTVLKVNSMLATIGMMILVSGISLSFHGGGGVSGKDIEASLAIEQPIAGILSPASIIAIALVLVLYVVVSQTTWGRGIYVIGGSDDAGRASGLPTGRIITTAFIVSGVTSALAGVVLGIGLNTGSPDFGSSILFTAMAAVVVGGVSLFGAEGSILGAGVGALLLASVNYGMNLGRLPTYLQTIVDGAILVLVVLLDSYFGHRRQRNLSKRLIDLRDTAAETPQREKAGTP